MKTTFLKWGLVVAGACLATAVVHPRFSRAADHLDAPGTVGEAAADINDVFAFMDKTDATATKAIFVMTVRPAAATTEKFSDAVQYVIRTQSGAAFGTVGNDFNIICTFNAAQTAQCWAGNTYLTGDASAAAGITSKDGKVKIFAGVRKDPFFFNLLGFQAAVNAVKGAVAGGGLVVDDGGCPDLTDGTGNAVAGLLNTTDGGAPQDFFANLNTLAIVAELDKTLVTQNGAAPIVAVSGSTHRKP